MKKLLTALPFVLMLAGCELYFGGDNTSGTDPTATGTGQSGGSATGNGYTCTTNADCAAGCFCSSGTCEEGGFCTSNADCGSGFFCDTSRSSCEPNSPTQPQGCTTNTDCTGAEQFCDATTNTCQTGSCAGTVTCNQGAPTCPSGSAPVIANGCYTGTCQAIASCDAPPACPNINDETDCLGRANDCQAVYTGIDCTNPTTGASCTSGEAGCTCASFQFDHCSAN